MASFPRDESARRRGQMGTAQILYKRVPRELIERPKAGFAVPVAARGAARSAARLAQALLEPGPPAARRLSGQAVVQQPLAGTSVGGRDWTARLWSILMFQAWCENASRCSS